MTSQAKVIIAGFAALSVALAIALGVALATDDGADDALSMGRGDDGYMGMMQAFGRMDPDEMLTMMHSVLGPDDYDEMLGHFAQHRAGTQMPHGSGIDGMMHRMMDGFFERMPGDENDVMPVAPR